MSKRVGEELGGVSERRGGVGGRSVERRCGGEGGEGSVVGWRVCRVVVRREKGGGGGEEKRGGVYWMER